MISIYLLLDCSILTGDEPVVNSAGYFTTNFLLLNI